MWGAIAGAVLGGGGSLLEAWGARDATLDYNRDQRNLVDNLKNYNYQKFLESRGQGGQALLPLYFPNNTETQLATDTLNNYLAMQAAAGTPSQEIANFQAAAQAMTPAQNEADMAVNNLFSGRMADQQVANMAPVAAARGAVAKAQKTGILEGLQARLNALSADRARAGYQGGGSALQKNILTSATIPALQAAGTIGAQADLANATDVANIRNTALNTQLQNINLPGQSAVNRMQLSLAPQAAAAQAQANRMNLFNWFKMPVQAFQWNMLPNQQIAPNNMMIAGAAMKGASQGVTGMIPSGSSNVSSASSSGFDVGSVL